MTADLNHAANRELSKMNLEVVILAAGKGTRMKSDLPKVLHRVAGIPMLEHVVKTAQFLNPDKVHIVVGHGSEEVQEALSQYSINWVLQKEQKGTGHAVLQVVPELDLNSVVLVMYGDVPLIESQTLESLINKAKFAPALLTAVLEDSHGYGRILRDEAGVLLGVVEEKDANETQRTIREINTGVLAAPAADLSEYLPLVKNENTQGEYYLPDILGLAAMAGKTIQSAVATSELEILGVNDRVQLNQVEREYQRKSAERLMRAGTSIADSNRIDVRGSLECEEDVSIDVNVVFEGNVVLGRGVTIGANCVLIDTVVGDGATIHPMSHLQDAVVGKNCSVGPYARLRLGTVLADGARIGNFVETKKANIGVGSKVNHLSYIGDCEMGAGVNVGAGTITCNYDGANKHLTELGDGVFIGSNSTLVAPIKIAENGFTAAGSTITKAVGKDELAVTRPKQRNVTGWQRPSKNNKG
ncbi:MAG: bifunctional UDP-N-acetylglucosamine pyrophosphorylase/glucosamine-1-phosphate N-acetyltransferase [Halioglobus sp.]|jgi:bifunctional UDP-N-acetylglucosamine pyrophosphorylase/glucosamine-1-phosphate N-acetyltransferase